MKNPFIVGSWVRGESFHGRDGQLAEVLQGNRRSVWAMGTRRVGKTSFLKQLEHMALQPEHGKLVPLFWDLEGGHDLNGFRDSLLESLEAVEDRVEALGLDLGELETRDMFGILRALKRSVRKASRRLLLLCDECEELLNLEQKSPEALPRLRRTLQEGDDVHVVLTATKRLHLLERGSTPQTSPFLHGFLPPIYLSRLTDEEACGLVRAGGFDENTVQQILERTDNHPYLLQLVCKRLFDTRDLTKVFDETSSDEMVSHFFNVDYEYLDPPEKDVILHVARRRRTSSFDLEKHQGMTSSQMEALLFGLRQMGYIRQDKGACSIANWFFEKWLAREHGPDAAVSVSRSIPESVHRFDGHSSLELLRRAQDGDRDALMCLCSRYQSAFSRWAEGRVPHSLRDRLDTDDLLRQVLFGAYSRIEPQREGELWEYLRQELLSRIRDELRAGESHDPQADGDGSQACPEEEIVGRATLQRYDEALAQLKSEERQAIVTRVEMGCSYAQVAMSLERPSEGAARMAVCRALVHLAAHMQGGTSPNTDDPRLLTLARSISDGSHIDWEEAQAASEGDEELRFLDRMRDVARLAWFHRARHLAAGLAPGADASSSQRISLETVDAASAVPSASSIRGSRGGQDAGVPFERWGHLELREKIGEGVFGKVFRAWETTLQREVALKLLRAEDGPHLIGSGPSSNLLLQEGRNLARVRHTNVVTVFGAEQLAGRVGIWMEFVHGRTLDEVLEDHGAFGAREAALIGVDLCRALTAVHSAGLVHRDIKARNVMREKGGRIVLMDFGAGADVRIASQTRTPAGTPVYLAPEIFQGVRASAQSDIYSLGVLLYHLVSTTFPVDGESLREITRLHERGQVKLLREVHPGLPEAFVQVVERALHPDPKERFSSAGQLEHALVSALV